MTNNGTPQLTTQDKGNGRTIVTVGTMPNPGTPAASPVRRSSMRPSVATTPPPANDGNTAPQQAVVAPVPQPQPDPTPTVEPQKEPDMSEKSSRKFNFQSITVPVIFLVAILAIWILDMSIGTPAALLLSAFAAGTALVALPLTNWLVRVYTDKVKGNEAKPTLVVIVVAIVLTVILTKLVDLSLPLIGEYWLPIGFFILILGAVIALQYFAFPKNDTKE